MPTFWCFCCLLLCACCCCCCSCCCCFLGFLGQILDWNLEFFCLRDFCRERVLIIQGASRLKNKTKHSCDWTGVPCGIQWWKQAWESLKCNRSLCSNKGCSHSLCWCRPCISGMTVKPPYGAQLDWCRKAWSGRVQTVCTWHSPLSVWWGRGRAWF